MKFGLSEKTIEKINGVFAAFPQVEKAVLFGSRAKGNYKNGSDIDLTLHGAELTVKVLRKIESQLEELLLPYKIDLSIFDQISNPDFAEHILRVGVVFYEKAGKGDVMRKGGTLRQAQRSELEGWKVEKLGDVIQKTETINPLQTPNKEFIYIDVSSVNNKTFLIEETSLIKGKDAPSRARKFIKAGDVIFATVRPTLKRIAIIPEEYDGQICSTGYFVLRGKEYINNKFLFYFLLSDSFNERMEKLQKGASYPAVTDTEVKEQIISYPPLPEQQRIVAMLDESFAALATVKDNAERNLVNARELFESHKQSVFDNSGKGWEMKTVGDVSEHSLGKMLDKQKNRGKNQKYLRNANVRWFEFDLSDVTEMRFLEEEAEKYTAVKGDLLICEGGYPGRAAIWQEDYPIFFQKAIHRVRFHKSEYTKWFLYFLHSSSANGSLKKYLTGTGIQHFTGQALDRFVFPVPPASEIRAIVGRLEALSAETKRLEEIYQQKLESLAELKKSILQKAFEGELSIIN